jgi:molybdopterin-guanine dinucleotide biosynthesis protein A
VIDEIGRLEIDHSSGFEPMVSECIESVKTSSHNTKLLLVIRDYLLEKAIAYYQLQDAIVLPRAFFELTPDSALSGLVLCGGLSSRMRQDKSMMMYHKAPQYMHLGHMLKLCCGNVFLSARAEQTSQYGTFPVITDHHAYANAGPLTGLLSAFHQLPNQSVLLLGCDYPYLTLTQIIELLQQRHKGYDVICFKNTDSGYAEPLIAVYEKSCIPKLKQFYASGQQSLRYFLQTVNTCYLTTNNKNIISVDFPINWLKLH